MSSEPLGGESCTEALVALPGGGIDVETHTLRPLVDGEARVKIEYGGICGSDLGYWKRGLVGESVIQAPMVLGHEVVGVVVDRKHDASGVQVGQRVTVHPLSMTREASADVSGMPRNLSRWSRYLGSAAFFPHQPGAFSRMVNLPISMLVPVPASLPPEIAVLAEPGAVALHAVHQAGPVAGRNVVIVGAGPIGLLTLAAVLERGAALTTVIDVHTRPLEIASSIGADTVLTADAAGGSALEADVVIESSGTVAGLNAAIEFARPGGKVVMVGLLPAGPQPIGIAQAISREVSLVGSFRFDAELPQTLSLLANRSDSVASIISHVFPLHDANTAFEIASQSAISGKVLLRFN